MIDMKSEQKLQESPTKELMDRHHDSDALTAYKHQMIQVYRPGGDQLRLAENYDEDEDSDEKVDEVAHYEERTFDRPQTGL